MPSTREIPGCALFVVCRWADVRGALAHLLSERLEVVRCPDLGAEASYEVGIFGCRLPARAKFGATFSGALRISEMSNAV